MSDDEERVYAEPDELAERRRLDRMQRTGAVPAGDAAARRVDVIPVRVTTKAPCNSCHKIVHTIRLAHLVECQRCEGDRNRASHDKLAAQIRQRNTDNGIANGPKRPKREEF